MAEWEVPGYTELKALGSGGFSTVVLARHDASGTPVAIKYLRRQLLADPEFAALFRSEATVLASLDDANVVRLYEYVESPSGAAIVMELVDGVSLREILGHQGATTAEAALVVLKGSLLGLAAAHRRGVVHRDYKPENVLVNGDGVSKLTDFGIAARTGDQPFPAGTMVYAPPEQFAGAPASPASDVYAATATFYECLAGRPPFSGDTVEALMYQHMSQPVPLDPVPEPLRPLVAAGMAKEPRDRPADGVSLVSALNAAASGEYGRDWEERGRSHLGEAALLLALLWPSGASPAVQGSATERVNLSRNPPKSHGSREARHLRHLRHLLHLLHLQHLRRGGINPAKAAAAVAAAIVVGIAGTFLAIGFNGSNASNQHLTVHPSVPPSSSPPGSSPPGSSLPAITGISPASGTTAGGTTVTITGTGLSGATSVSFGSVAAKVLTDSATQIAGTGPAEATSVSSGSAAAKISADSATQVTVTSPRGTGTVHITVTTSAGTSVGTAADRFTYVAPPPPPPVVTRISPASGSTAGGTTVTIAGTGLSGATGVSFGGAAATISADSATQITVTSPPGTGTVDITVTAPGGISAVTTADKFTYFQVLT